MKHFNIMKNLMTLALLLTLAACQEQYVEKRLSDHFVMTDYLSSQQITAFEEDSQGYIWIGTKRGLNRFNGRSYNQYFLLGDSMSVGNNGVNCLSSDDCGNLWIGTINNLFVYKPGEGMRKVADDYVTMMGETKEGHFLFGNFIHISRVDKRNYDVVECYKFSKPNFSNRFETDSAGNLWVTEGEEAKQIDIMTGEVLAVAPAKEVTGKDDDEVSVTFEDSHGNLWIGTNHHGYRTIYNKHTAWSSDSHTASALKGKMVNAVHADAEGMLWVVAEDKYLYRCSPDGDVSHIYSATSGVISRLWTDSKKMLWFFMSDMLCRGKVEDGKYAMHDSWRLFPSAIEENDRGDIYVVSNYSNKIFCLKNGNSDFQELSTSFDTHRAIKLMRLRDGRLAMLDAFHGLLITDSNLDSGEFQQYKMASDSQKSIVFTDFYEDNNGRIWLATYGGGVMCADMGSGNVRDYESNEYCKDVSSVIVDEDGRIWMGTCKGLTRLDPETGKFTTYYKEDNLTDDEFSLRGATKTADNRLVLGNMSGITIFNPKEVAEPEKRRLELEYLTVDGNVVQDLNVDRNIVLSHDNVGVDISFTTLQFGGSAPSYQYKMDGFDLDWNTIHGSEHAYYSHLPYGKYVFKVKQAGRGGDAAERTVRVTVLPSFWELPVMKFFIYPMSGLLVICGFVYLWHRRRLNKRRIEEIMKEKEQEQRANEMNMRFFSNISHEFRTPLTLINGALSMIKDDGRLISIMRRNTQRMMRMVGQLMDFNKMENGMMRLSVSKVDVKELLREIVNMFEASMKSHGMECRLELPSQDVTTWLDVDKFEKVMVNLISNAIKYSGDGSTITVRLATVERNMMQVDVADTGVGVPEDKREEIFVRFYQLKQSGQMPAIGTGIGLYYTRSLVELHHGWIRCLGNEPHGSVFRFVVPMNKSEYENDEIKEVRTTVAVVGRPQGSPLQAQETPMEHKQGDVSEEQIVGQRVMVVDDDAEVMEFLRLLLGPHYQIHSYSDARTAYHDIENVKPELILSDVMMAEMDGYTFCRMIKDNSAICHIPVVLLTAKTAIEEQIHGLDCGASAYVTKPFAPEYLLSMLKSQIDNLHRIQKTLNESTTVPPKEKAVLQEADQKFMKEFYAYIEEHLSDAELQIDELTVKLGMSRSKFFYKTKALTGETPNAFFKTFKLNRAAEMILEGKEKISYIADVTGFASSSHFATNFKKRFSCLPSEYKK